MHAPRQQTHAAPEIPFCGEPDAAHLGGVRRGSTLRVPVCSARRRKRAIGAFAVLFLAPPAWSYPLNPLTIPPSAQPTLSVAAPCSVAGRLSPCDRFTSSGRLYWPDFSSSGTPTAISSPPELHLGTALRAGVIEEVPAEPDLPKVIAGSVTWSFDPTRPALIASFTATAWRGEVIITPQGPPDGKFLRFEIRLEGPGPTTLNFAPRIRRTGAAEGEPLIGRITRAQGGLTVFDTSADRVDHANNLARLTGPPWLDLILRPDRPQLVITLEKPRAANAVMDELLSR